MVELTVNGEAVTLTRAPDVRALLAHLSVPESGVAVAVDGAVRPRSRWGETIPDRAVVDVVTAVQGG